MATKIKKTDWGVEICWDYVEGGSNTWEAYYTKRHVDALMSASNAGKKADPFGPGGAFGDMFGGLFGGRG